jgi:competence protein ComEC
MSYLAMLSLGIFSIAWWPLLPRLEIIFAVMVCSIPLCISLWAALKLRLLFTLLMGVSLGLISGHLLIKDSLPTAFDGEDILLTGTIVGLVDSNAKRSRFSFRVDSALPAVDSSCEIALKKILISWYGKNDLKPGQRWQLLARLRQPRGFVNPRAFDYQAWLLQQAYGATGYVRAAYPAARLQNNPLSFDSLALAPAILSAELRTELRERIDSANLSARGRAVILALTIGDKQRLSEWWQDLARMGIVHLLVISGLHIGLIALLGTIVGSGLNRGIILFRQLLCRLGLCSPTINSMPWIAPLCGLLAAFLYSLLAGFSLPTQRALIAVTVIVAARLCYRKIRPLLCMLWALLLIAVSQPLAVLSAGFWLSFTAVGLLIWWFTPWQSTENRSGLRRLISAQLALLVAMSVPLLLFLGKVSWLAPLVNLLAVPWVSFITVPLSLFGALMPSSFLAGIFWQWADWSIAALWWLLDAIPEQLGFIVSPLAISAQVLCAVILAGLALLLPRGIATRWIATLPLVLLLIFPKADIPLRITVLDVGQGLAVTVKTENHTLVYDTGVEYSRQFSAGSGIIAPYLWQQGRGRIDTTVVSHEDADHSGGLAALQKVLPSQIILAGPAVTYKDSVIKNSQFIHCNAGQDWLWDGIKFQVLAAEDRPESGNNSSCILLISFRNAVGRQVNILLPGDVERSGELALLKLPALEGIALDLLIAPHHGSKTSSTDAFVRRLVPEHVVFSAGYRHQFGHPHRTVVERYREVGSKMWNTGEQGAISFSWLATGELQVSAARHRQLRWWR